MKKIGSTWNLEISRAFIEKYHLDHLLNHDPFYTIFDDPELEIYQLPIDRFSYNLSNEGAFLDQFIERFKKFLEIYNAGNHIDELLFLSLSYKSDFRYKEVYNSWHKILRDRAKILYNMISPNPFEISFDGAVELLIDSGEHEDDINEILVDYLCISSNKQRSNFVNHDRDLLKALFEKEGKEALHLIAEKYAIKVNTSDSKQLYVAGNITSDVEFKIRKQKISLPTRYLKSTIEHIVTSLYNEQKTHNTIFYRSLENVDFVKRTGLDELEKSTKLHGMASFHAYILNIQRTLLLKYLDDNNVLAASTKETRKRLRDNFVYQYFTFFGLIKPKPVNREDIEKLQKELENFNKAKENNPHFATSYFNNTFKNISDKEETFEKKARIQFL